MTLPVTSAKVLPDELPLASRKITLVDFFGCIYLLLGLVRECGGI